MRKPDHFVWQEDLGREPDPHIVDGKRRNPANLIPLHLIAHNERIVTVEQLQRLARDSTARNVRELLAIIGEKGNV